MHSLVRRSYPAQCAGDADDRKADSWGCSGPAFDGNNAVGRSHVEYPEIVIFFLNPADYNQLHGDD